jgi:hypothetical protein
LVTAARAGLVDEARVHSNIDAILSWNLQLLNFMVVLLSGEVAAHF